MRGVVHSKKFLVHSPRKSEKSEAIKKYPPKKQKIPLKSKNHKKKIQQYLEEYIEQFGV
jgi:hypothetical protein